MKLLLTTLLLAVGFTAVPGTAAAHKVSIFAWVEGDTIHTLSKFSGGKKVKNGHVTVFDPEGKQLLDGRTDHQGEFAFKIPQKTGLRVELTAGAGHKGFWLIEPEEITGGLAQETAGDAGKASPKKTIDTERISSHDNAQLEAAIEKILDEKLKPVMKLLAESRQTGPSLTEIFGGIGYILGLVGIAAYFKSRQKK